MFADIFIFSFMFQFHKVRLKDREKAIQLGIEKFQFHKVRLKAWAEPKRSVSS